MELIIPHKHQIKVVHIPHIQRNDCSIRCFKTAFDLSYEDADELLKRFCKKEKDRGVRTIHLFQFLDHCYKVNDKSVVRLSIKSYPSVQSLVLYHQKGTFIIAVRGHVFTVKDGTVMGNSEDKLKLKRRIVALYQVLDHEDQTPSIPLLSITDAKLPIQVYQVNNTVGVKLHEKYVGSWE